MKLFEENKYTCSFTPTAERIPIDYEELYSIYGYDVEDDVSELRKAIDDFCECYLPKYYDEFDKINIELIRLIKNLKENGFEDFQFTSVLAKQVFINLGIIPSELEFKTFPLNVIEKFKLYGIGAIDTIDGKTSGLKRTKHINDHIPHHVPITAQMEKIFARAKRFNQGEKYIFPPIRESRFDHLDPSAPNNFLRNLGFEGKLVTHGWRSVALTNGIDLLKTSKEVIKKQMGHLPDNKVDQAYDKSLMLEERRIFLNKWCDLLVANGLEV